MGVNCSANNNFVPGELGEYPIAKLVKTIDIHKHVTKLTTVFYQICQSTNYQKKSEKICQKTLSNDMD